MSEDERKNYNMKRRQKQQAIPKVEEGIKEDLLDEDSQRRLKEQNAKKAETARQRYHRMVKRIGVPFSLPIDTFIFRLLTKKSCIISDELRPFVVGGWRKKLCWQCQ
jgi:hypothetical protein